MRPRRRPAVGLPPVTIEKSIPRQCRRLDARPRNSGVIPRTVHSRRYLRECERPHHLTPTQESSSHRRLGPAAAGIDVVGELCGDAAVTVVETADFWCRDDASGRRRRDWASTNWCRSATISRCSAARERTKNRERIAAGGDDGHDESSLFGMACNLNRHNTYRVSGSHRCRGQRYWHAGLSGYDLIRQARERGHCVPMIAVTGFDTPEHRRQISRHGFAYHLTKPFDPDHLVAVVGETVHGQGSRPPTLCCASPQFRSRVVWR